MKVLRYMLALFFFVLVSGCAHTYSLSENWVDEDDLQQILKTPEIQKTARNLGTPVFTEYRGDTVEFVYNYKPHLYKTEKDGRLFKPNDSDRLDLWSERTEFVGLLVVENRVVGIRPRPDYQTVQNAAQAKTSGSAGWIIVLILTLVVGTVAIITAVD
ncbi:MAG: hypothetical protein J6U20_11030 [Fibrobacter sp.]|nr:hypothetical protein [Fibrobacter sp.]